MHRFYAVAAAFLLSSAAIGSVPVQAMEIQLWAHLSAKDEQDYLDQLVDGSQKVLIDAGRQADAAKVHQLFTFIHQGDALSIGDAEFEGNIAKAQVFDAKRHLDNPGARRLEIEDALVVTLKKHGIELPSAFFSVMSNFKPKYPPPH